MKLLRYSFMQSLKKIISLTGLCCFLLFTGSSQAADGLIEEVHFHGENGDSESVSFLLNGPYLPKAFALKGEKPRVVFDFMETRLDRTVPTSIDVGGKMIRKIRLARYDHKTRAVIDLVPGLDINFEQTFDETQNILTIQLFSPALPEKQESEPVAAVTQQEESPESVSDSEVAAEKVTGEEVVVEAAIAEEVVAEEVVANEVVAEEVVAATPAVTETPSREVVETTVESLPVPAVETGPSPDPLLSSVSFEDTSDKGEMVLFKLNGFYPPVVSGEEDGTPKVVCNFAGTRLAESVVREQATNGKYIREVRSERIDDSDLVRVTLNLVANKNYDLQQVFFKEDNLFVIIVNSYDALAAPVK